MNNVAVVVVSGDDGVMVMMWVRCGKCSDDSGGGSSGGCRLISLNGSVPQKMGHGQQTGCTTGWPKPECSSLFLPSILSLEAFFLPLVISGGVYHRVTSSVDSYWTSS
ncbi:hypothetical protein Tco_0201760 [Tanacetum coccineum]